MTEYIIVGDTEEYKGCLVCLCGNEYDHAKDVLHRMLNNPNPNDKMLKKGCTNLRIKEVVSEDCWWHYGCD